MYDLLRGVYFKGNGNTSFMDNRACDNNMCVHCSIDIPVCIAMVLDDVRSFYVYTCGQLLCERNGGRNTTLMAVDKNGAYEIFIML